MTLSAEVKDALLKRICAIPIMETLKIEVLALAEGYCETKIPRKPDYDGVFESFHGGLLMTIADTTACYAILTQTGPDAKLTTTDMNIRFLAPCLTDVTARARVIKLGRTLCPVAVDLFDANDRQVAVAQVSYFLINP
jgi:uncharacterized protein (TIGR00369 family)